MEKAFDVIYEIVRQIPKGRVCTYGGIARLAGNPRWARIVGYAMRAAATRQCRVTASCIKTERFARHLNQEAEICRPICCSGRAFDSFRTGKPIWRISAGRSRRLDETEETKYAEQNKWFHGGENARGRKNHGRSFILSGRS